MNIFSKTHCPVCDFTLNKNKMCPNNHFCYHEMLGEHRLQITPNLYIDYAEFYDTIELRKYKIPNALMNLSMSGMYDEGNCIDLTYLTIDLARHKFKNVEDLANKIKTLQLFK